MRIGGIIEWAQYLYGQKLGPYLVGAFLGGTRDPVFRGTDLRSDTAVAIKILSPMANADPVRQRQFETEAALLSTLEASRALVGLRDSGVATVELRTSPNADPTITPLRYHVLELASSTMAPFLVTSSGDGNSWRQFLQYWRDIVYATHSLHQHGIAHGDIKADNCLIVSRAGHRLVCRLSDLSRSVDLRNPRLGQRLTWPGDLTFAPPEFFVRHIPDQVDAYLYGDLYSLGSLLFKAATGRGPTEASLVDEKSSFSIGLVLVGLEGRCDTPVELRPDYKSAFAEFAEKVPSEIREPATALVRRLCDPVPEARTPSPGGHKDLTWLLREAELLQRAFLPDR